MLKIFKIIYPIWFILSVAVFIIWATTIYGMTEKRGEKYYFNNHGKLTEISQERYKKAKIIEIVVFSNHFLMLDTLIISVLVFQIIPLPGFKIKGEKCYKGIESGEEIIFSENFISAKWEKTRFPLGSASVKAILTNKRLIIKGPFVIGKSLEDVSLKRITRIENATELLGILHGNKVIFKENGGEEFFVLYSRKAKKWIEKFIQLNLQVINSAVLS